MTSSRTWLSWVTCALASSSSFFNWSLIFSMLLNCSSASWNCFSTSDFWSANFFFDASKSLAFRLASSNFLFDSANWVSKCLLCFSVFAFEEWNRSVSHGSECSIRKLRDSYSWGGYNKTNCRCGEYDRIRQSHLLMAKLSSPYS